jgi:Asp-tRNA(Asn)/Glu-tRNA(Gln) amidotransferase C subunit
MIINIETYIHISNIAIKENEKSDITDGVVAILDYADILKNIVLKEEVANNSIESRYRDQNCSMFQFSKDIMVNNAPQLMEKYFVVPNLIIRKS